MTYLWFPYWAMSWNARSHACFPVVWRDRCNDRRSCHYQAERTLRLGREWSQYGNRPCAEEQAKCIVWWLRQIWTTNMDSPPERSELCACIAKHLFLFCLFCFAIHATLHTLKKNSCSPGSKQIKKRRIKNWMSWNHHILCLIYTSMYRYGIFH